ncbi:uncharacterized protein LOC133194321 [Saccostrea echinata]|uniref:uncharacterized protein LOC133194321 n=1 Tax=Saccostrea echinata TaxID=191078 RepID=UPI002A82F719|nr:uncharacterized protein LOC133194321 [Saccostrea echinata]
MDKLGISSQYKARQCSQCQGDTEFYCNMCKHDLCLQCKERHVIDLDTKHHDVVIYREICESITKQEICVRHPDKIYEMFCNLCKLPVCFRCKEHKQHLLHGLRTAYKTNRLQQKGNICHIRSETLYNSCFLLPVIKTDIETCLTEISKRQSELFIKANRLKNLIDTVMCDVKIRYTRYMMQRIQQQKRKMNIYLVSIENYEHRTEFSANTPVKFLFFIKRPRVTKIKETPSLSQNLLLSLTEELNKQEVINLLSDIQIIEAGKRQVRNEYLLKLMKTVVIYRSVKVTGVRQVRHISSVTSGKFWINDGDNLILTNIEGKLPLSDDNAVLINRKNYVLHQLTDIVSGWGVHTVTINGDLIYIDRDDNINRLYKDNETKSTLIKKTKPWKPRCVYSSRSNGDLLVGMWKTDTDTGKVTRYNDKGQCIQTIQQNNTGQGLYRHPFFITENCNGDLIVSDWSRGAVVVTEHRGRYRNCYTGPPSGTGLSPRGVCTDALSNILVCDAITYTVQMIDKDGNFLTLILEEETRIDGPRGLTYDDETHLLWVGLWHNTVVKLRYIERQDNQTGK